MRKIIEPGCLIDEICYRDGCKGTIEELDTDRSCSCHINPPCSVCTEPREYCPECGWMASEEVDPITQPESTGGHTDWYTKKKPLDKAKIDWRSKPHSSSSMIKEGVYPAGTTEEQVREKVNGTFGGRFEHFGNGTFKFIAYTN
jgi:hypothetical protein